MHRFCAACGGSAKTRIYQQRFVMPTRHGFHAGYDVVACDRCGFTFADDTPDQAFLDAYYREMAKKTAMLERHAGDAHVEPDFIVRQHEHSLRNILPHVRPGDRVLDIGAYTGHLLALIRRAMPTAHVLGLDPSDFAAKIAREQHAVEVRVGSLFDELDLGEFDVITVTHVLEHIVELRPFLTRLLGLLADGGRLYVEVPDAANFFFSDDPHDGLSGEHRDPFLQFSVEHVNYFTATSLANLMRSNGFEQIAIDTQVSIVSLVASTWTRRAFVRDAIALPSLQGYVDASRARLGAVLTTIAGLRTAGAEIAVWGAGAHTQRLLAAGDLAGVPIRFFVDSDAGYHGATLLGRQIYAPSILAEHPDLAILISSQMYEDEIEAQIQAMGLSNRVITLYRGARA